MKLGIDASRNRSGGAIAHMIGLIGAAEPEQSGIEEVHVWSHAKLLRALPDRSWLVRHNPPELERGILSQLYWQRYRFSYELERMGCGIVFNTDAGSIGRFAPSVTMSQDMLSYEPGEMERMRWGKARIRLFLLRYMQNQSLLNANGAIFLTKYASELIQRSCKELSNVKIIPHGVHESFRGCKNPQTLSLYHEKEIQCLYVSNVATYKHQWHVVRAIAKLRSAGYPLKLTLIGGGDDASQRRLDTEILASDPSGAFVTQHPFLDNDKLPQIFSETDLFIFASSCENMPITLIEGMAAGLPIACSDRGPMPEVLRDGGVYFNPEKPSSIVSAVRVLLDNSELWTQWAQRSMKISGEYSWKRCADETFAFLAEIYKEDMR